MTAHSTRAGLMPVKAACLDGHVATLCCAHSGRATPSGADRATTVSPYVGRSATIHKVAGRAGLAAMEFALPCPAGARRGEEGLSRADSRRCHCTHTLPMNRVHAARPAAVHPKAVSCSRACP